MPDRPSDMNAPPPLPAEYINFSEWIETATRGLCDEARNRISAEMRRHVTETAAELVDAGMSDTEAFDAALRQLGNAKAARRGFLRTNLTKSEHSMLVGSPISPLFPDPEFFRTFVMRLMDISAVMFGLVGIFFIFAMFFPSVSWSRVYHGLGSLFFTAAFLSGWMAERCRLRCLWRRALFARSVSMLAISLMAFDNWQYFTTGTIGVVGYSMTVLVAGGMLFAAFIHARLWWKLRRVAPPVTTGL